ncbi:hypothetical protein NL455_29320, partial [Klebsiella pneumoniae]|nr:hypothetical protein [Klebsiella pneumoniae]
IRIQSKLTGDIVIISAMESGENTGLFQFSLATEENAEKNLNDAVLQTLKRDEVTASLVECVDEQGQATTPINDISTQILI